MANFKGRYQEYLESPEWDELRKEAYKQTNHRCELCGDFAEAVHHIKYPKSFNEDCLENLLQGRSVGREGGERDGKKTFYNK